VTSTTNTRELERLRKARRDARDRFARQMKLLERIEATAGELEKITTRWRGQLAALAELSGSPATAAALSGLPKPDIEAAARSVDRTEVDAVLAAAVSSPRRRRRTSQTAATAPEADTPVGSST
jgi:hypothetical protein